MLHFCDFNHNWNVPTNFIKPSINFPVEAEIFLHVDGHDEANTGLSLLMVNTPEDTSVKVGYTSSLKW